MRRATILLAMSAIELLVIAGCQETPSYWDRMQAEDAAREARRNQEMEARIAQERTEREAMQAKKKADWEAQEAKRKADELAAVRAEIAKANSFDEFESIFNRWRWRNISAFLEVEAAMNKWYLRRYYVPKNILPAIEARWLVLGMTTDQVRASRGFPERVNRTTGSWGVHEQWVMRDDMYLYFENDKLTGWQD